MQETARRCAVIGHPVGHSLSPALHRAAYAALGLDWQFDAIDVAPGGLPDFLANLDPTWRGLAVTMPHKGAAASLGTPDQATARLGVANTLLASPTGWQARNTDIAGFIHALEYRRLDDVEDVVILGAGATARSALLALANLGVSRISAQVRDIAHAKAWLDLAAQLGLVADAETLGTAHAAQLVLSTLPAGVADQWAPVLVANAQAVFDVSYDPWPTVLLSQAQALGLPVVSGLDLLAGQAIQQIDLMVGDTIDMASLLAAGQAELRRREMA